MGWFSHRQERFSISCWPEDLARRYIISLECDNYWYRRARFIVFDVLDIWSNALWKSQAHLGPTQEGLSWRIIALVWSWLSSSPCTDPESGPFLLERVKKKRKKTCRKITESIPEQSFRAWGVGIGLGLKAIFSSILSSFYIGFHTHYTC